MSCSKSWELHNYWRWEIILLCEIGVLWLSEVGVDACGIIVLSGSKRWMLDNCLR